ncbi:proline-rich receptor-like protein kinase PERK8 [Phaseolus vulgaris]|uniref:proline-rich receptor-like protein kinase PERK8 n=1 Tax=Phaseolus vulgaris TaxID=3885 RepID=UPI0035C9C881
MDSATRAELARSLKARLGAQSAKAGASITSPLKSNSSPPSLPPRSSRTPSSPHQTPNSPLSSETPSTAQTPHSPPTIQTPHSPLPIAAVPLAAASAPSIAPLDKGKRVLTVSSEDDDSDVGPAYKRRRTNRVVHSRSPTPPHGGSLRDNPPSATSPTCQSVQGERVVESMPLPALIPTPPPPSTTTPTPSAPATTPGLSNSLSHHAADEGF